MPVIYTIETIFTYDRLYEKIKRQARRAHPPKKGWRAGFCFFTYMTNLEY